jgi:hypothetical protein
MQQRLHESARYEHPPARVPGGYSKHRNELVISQPAFLPLRSRHKLKLTLFLN